MAVTFYRTGTQSKTFGTSVPRSGNVQRNNAPGSTERISAADVDRIFRSSIEHRAATNNFEHVVEVLYELFPMLLKSNPYLKWAPAVKRLYEWWQKTKMQRGKLSVFNQTIGVNHLDASVTTWEPICSSGPQAGYPNFGGVDYSFGHTVGPGSCGIGGQAWPRDIHEHVHTDDSATASEWYWGDFGPFGEKGVITSQQTRPSGSAGADLPVMDTGYGQEFGEGYDTPPHIKPAPQPMPYSSIPDRKTDPFTYERGYDDPSSSTDIQTQTDTAFAYGGPTVGRTRQGSKERKFNLSGAELAQFSKFAAILGNVYGKLADFRDIINALNESLPKHLQIKSKSLPKLLANVWAHLDQLHPTDAVLNVLKELAEDQVGGASDFFASKSAIATNSTKQKFHLSPRGANVGGEDPTSAWIRSIFGIS